MFLIAYFIPPKSKLNLLFVTGLSLCARLENLSRVKKRSCPTVNDEGLLASYRDRYVSA